MQGSLQVGNQPRVAQHLLVQLSIVDYQPFGGRHRLSHQETGTAVLRVVSVLIRQDEARVSTFLCVAFNLISLLFRSWIGLPTYVMPDERMLQLEIHLDELITGSWRG